MEEVMLKTKNFFNIKFILGLIVVVLGFMALGCSYDQLISNNSVEKVQVDNSNNNISNQTQETESNKDFNLNLNKNNNVNSNLKPNTNTNVNTNTKQLTPQLRNLMDVKFETTGSGNSDIYNITYIAKSTGLVAAEISIITLESEVIGIEVRYISLGKMVTLLQKSGEKPVYDTGNGFKPTNDLRIPKFFASSKKIVDEYETNLKVREERLEDFFYLDCPNFPKDWLLPIPEE